MLSAPQSGPLLHVLLLLLLGTDSLNTSLDIVLHLRIIYLSGIECVGSA